MTMIKLTRLYTKKGSKAVKRQVFFVAADAIESVRSSTLMASQKATIVTKSGMVVPVTETHNQIVAAVTRT